MVCYNTITYIKSLFPNQWYSHFHRKNNPYYDFESHIIDHKEIWNKIEIFLKRWDLLFEEYLTTFYHGDKEDFKEEIKPKYNFRRNTNYIRLQPSYSYALLDALDLQHLPIIPVIDNSDCCILYIIEMYPNFINENFKMEAYIYKVSYLGLRDYEESYWFRGVEFGVHKPIKFYEKKYIRDVLEELKKQGNVKFVYFEQFDSFIDSKIPSKEFIDTESRYFYHGSNVLIADEYLKAMSSLPGEKSKKIYATPKKSVALRYLASSQVNFKWNIKRNYIWILEFSRNEFDKLKTSGYIYTLNRSKVRNQFDWDENDKEWVEITSKKEIEKIYYEERIYIKNAYNEMTERKDLILISFDELLKFLRTKEIPTQTWIAEDKNKQKVIMEAYVFEKVTKDYLSLSRELAHPISITLENHNKHIVDVAMKNPNYYDDMDDKWKVYFKGMVKQFKEGKSIAEYTKADDLKEIDRLEERLKNGINCFEHAHSTCIVLAKDFNKKLLGFIEFWASKNDVTNVQIEPLGVLPYAQKRGLSRLLCFSILKIWPKTKRLFLGTMQDTRDIYLALGFKPFDDHGELGLRFEYIVDEISFPEEELNDLKGRLDHGYPIYTTRSYREVDKYKEGNIYHHNFLGPLKVISVQIFFRVEDHPAFREFPNVWYSDKAKPWIEELAQNIGYAGAEWIKLEKHKYFIVEQDSEKGQFESMMSVITEYADLQKRGIDVKLPKDDYFILLANSPEKLSQIEEEKLFDEFQKRKLFVTIPIDKIKKILESNKLQLVINRLKLLQKNWGFVLFDKYKVIPQVYGTEGGYDEKDGVILVQTDFDGNPIKSNERFVHTIIHETVHIGIEKVIVKKFDLNQKTKETLVEAICKIYLADLIPKYVVEEEIDDELYKKITLEKIMNLPVLF